MVWSVIGSPSFDWTCRRVCSGIRTSISNGSIKSVNDSSADRLQDTANFREHRGDHPFQNSSMTML